jgi:hypothetical protein
LECLLEVEDIRKADLRNDSAKKSLPVTASALKPLSFVMNVGLDSALHVMPNYTSFPNLDTTIERE